jgi:hypothetical protein
MEEAARLVKQIVDKRLFKMPKTFAQGVPATWDVYRPDGF